MTKVDLAKCAELLLRNFKSHAQGLNVNRGWLQMANQTLLVADLDHNEGQ